MPEDENPHLHHFEKLQTHPHMHSHTHTHTHFVVVQKNSIMLAFHVIFRADLSVSSVKPYTKARDGMEVLLVAVND